MPEAFSAKIDQIGEEDQRRQDKIFGWILVGLPILSFIGWIFWNVYDTNRDIWDQ